MIGGLIALIQKELDAIRPYWWAVWAALLVLLAGHCLEGLAHDPRSELLAYDFEDWGFLGGLLAFSLGHSMVAAEYRDGHVEFLDGLPLSRWMVYLSKVIAAAAPLATLVVGTAVVKVLVVLVLNGPHGLSPLAAELEMTLRFGALLAGFCGLGLLFSWLGGLGWGVLLLGSFTMMVFSIIWPVLRPYLFFDGMLVLDWQGTVPMTLWGPVFLWSFLGASSAALSGLLFLGPGQWLVNQRTWSAFLLRNTAIGCGTLIFLFFAGLMGIDAIISGSRRLLAPTERVDTEHFRFLYPSNQKGQALELIARSEAISATLGAEMGNPEPLVLDIEMLGASKAHAGVFLGGKIRMVLDGDATDTLTHELAHAHAFALSGWKVQHQFHKVRFFEEGLARHYEQRHSDDPADDTWAAAIWKTNQARFDLLVEDDRRSKKHDGDQAYALGEAFVGGLVELHGDAGVTCLLGALGELGTEDIAGMSLWVEATTQCGIDLDAVVKRYDDNLRASSERLPPLPDLSARLDASASGTDLVVHDRHETGMTAVCRFRDDADTPRQQFDQTWVRDGRCYVPSSSMSGSSFEYQLGFELEGSTFPVFGEWTTAAL